MKRGINDKNMGPMFPRLHVNDTEKGGPRAPPRNKMALYEQLSIPSQRFSGADSTSNNAPIPSVSERCSFLPHQQTHRVQAADKTNNRYNNQLVQEQQKKKQQDEDFRVPVMNLDHSGNHQNKVNERNKHQNTNVRLKETNGSNNSIRSQSNLTQDHVVDSQTEVNETIRDVGYRNRLIPVKSVQQEVIKSTNDVINCDDLSENSMIDSISGLDISPDDVVGVIGQKHFWKARRAIVNQQRVFNVQLFELHRLIKVQRLIAEIPHSMVENDPLLGKPAKVAPIKKIPLPLEHVLKPSTNVPKVKDYVEKSKDDTGEVSAENAVEKTSNSSVQNSSCSTLTGYPLPPSDPNMGPWSLSQQPGHQWLIPFMSPSEGLIYKPYPGPGYMTPGPGPPSGHNFVNHGVPPPAQPHYQWPTGPTGFHFPSSAHGYFPPYGMTPMNPSYGENMNPLNMQYQSSPYNNNEVQVSTASSPSEQTENRDPLPLFPTGPTEEGVPEPTRAIRVVPRNARSATQSIARIFQFMQEERKKQDSD